jgi:hypothetical protein
LEKFNENEIILKGAFVMYDKYLIVENEVKNIVSAGQVTGFQVGMRLPYYRGVVLSLVGGTVLSVDGEEINPEQMKVTLHGKTYPMIKLEDEPVEKWEFGEVGIVTVTKPGGLQKGDHKLEIRQHMKISYVPGGFWGGDIKTIKIA